ncbi:hypothetical protein [Streptomyces atratus]
MTARDPAGLPGVLAWPWPGGGIRICGQIHNLPAEYERLAVGLRSLLDGR